MNEEIKNDSVFVRSRLISFASNFIAGILVFAFTGYQMDKYFETEKNFYLLIGIFLGFIWSMYETFRLVKVLNKPKNNSDASNHE